MFETRVLYKYKLICVGFHHLRFVMDSKHIFAYSEKIIGSSLYLELQLFPKTSIERTNTGFLKKIDRNNHW